jgi:hypothetical protein
MQIMLLFIVVHFVFPKMCYYIQNREMIMELQAWNWKVQYFLVFL